MSDQPIRVLVIDDEAQIRRFLRATLSAHGYYVLEASLGAEGLDRLTKDRPDLLILDLGLPDIDGIEIISRIREWSRIPIIILSVRDSESDKIDALDRGADDYVTKPFAAGELLARIRTALRHQLQSVIDKPVYTTGDLTIDLVRRRVTLRGEELKLTPKEYDILRHLVIHAGKVLTHSYLLTQIWGPGSEDKTPYLRVHVGTLRGKIERNVAEPRYILTEPGVGYRLRNADERVQESGDRSRISRNSKRP